MLLEKDAPSLLGTGPAPPLRSHFAPSLQSTMSKMRPKKMPYRRSLTTVLIMTLLALLYIWNVSTLVTARLPSSLAPQAPKPSPPRAKTCPMDAGYLKKRNDLTSEIVYSKKCIRTVFDDSVDRADVVDVTDASMFANSQVLDLGRPCQDWQELACEPTTLRVPPPYPARVYSEFTFGVATGFDRLIDSLPQFRQWLSGSGARLVAVVVDLDEHVRDMGYLQSLYQGYDIDLVICSSFHPSLGVNEQHFTIVRDLLKHMTPTTKWIGIIDDDTFFPSLHPLAEIMDYQDADESLYIGALSDSLDAIRQHGTMAYGGAGAFLSLPLARQLEPAIEACLDEIQVQQGDALLKQCIYAKTDTTLTVMPGLNQADLMGNVDGFYESGRLPVSLHHWKSWHHAPVEQIAKASTFCGDCLLQRWRFGEDTVLNNGYSIAVYNDGISQAELNKTESTFQYEYLYEWSLGPLREKTQEDRKKSYHLIESELVDGGLRQIYVHRARDENTQYPDGLSDTTSEKDEVLELWWEV